MPAFNEEASIASVIKDIYASVPDADVLVVDDGSSDQTAAIAETTSATVLRLPFNLGIGGAMRLGYLYATRNGYDIVVQVDADGQHDTACIPDLVAALDDADIVVGSRFAAGDSTYKEARGPRRMMMRILAAGIRPWTGVRLTDATSGFRAVGPRGLPLFARELPAEYFGDCLGGLVIAHRAGLTVTEVSVRMGPRIAGEASQTTWGSIVHLTRAFVMLGVAATRRRPDSIPVDQNAP